MKGLVGQCRQVPSPTQVDNFQIVKQYRVQHPSRSYISTKIPKKRNNLLSQLDGGQYMDRPIHTYNGFGQSLPGSDLPNIAGLFSNVGKSALSSAPILVENCNQNSPKKNRLPSELNGGQYMERPIHTYNGFGQRLPGSDLPDIAGLFSNLRISSHV
jgi:hypothetical protein